jgi:6-phospho-3-hexuloisomerase
MATENNVQISNILNNSSKILEEIWKVFSISDFSEEDLLARGIFFSNKIVCVGAGRMGYAMRGFAMRLKHLGRDVYMIGDTNVPSIGEGDLLIVGSGSGETQTIYDLVNIAKNNGARIAVITGNADSRIGKLSDIKIIIKAPSKTKAVEGLKSKQPMTSLNEQCLAIFFDSLVLGLMKESGETHETMWRRHSNLE